jgi:hypothetical protein
MDAKQIDRKLLNASEATVSQGFVVRIIYHADPSTIYFENFGGSNRAVSAPWSVAQKG